MWDIWLLIFVAVSCEKMAKKNPFSVTKEYFIEGRKKIRQRLLAKHGPGPYTKEERQKINQEVRKRMEKKNRARIHHQFMKIEFDKQKVCLRVPNFGYKKLKFRPSQLIKHFSPQEIRRAAVKYMKLKRRLEM